MFSHSALSKIVVAALVVGCAAFTAPASALEKPHSSYQNLGGNCHAVSPADEIFNMKRSELGYRNTQLDNQAPTQNAVVVCNLLANGWAVYNNGFIRSVQLYARNLQTDNPSTLTCTITAGYATSSTIYTSTKSTTLTTDGKLATIFWRHVADNGGSYFPAPASIACSVPAGAELNDAELTFMVDVGS